MPDKTTVAGELPELPAPNYTECGPRFVRHYYDAQQMRDYATAALAQKDGEIAALRLALKNLEFVASFAGIEDEAERRNVGIACEAARAAIGSQA